MKRPMNVTVIGIASILVFVVFASLFGYISLVEPESTQVWTISVPFLWFIPLPLYVNIVFLIFVTAVSILFLKGLKWTWYFFVGFWAIESIGFAMLFVPLGVWIPLFLLGALVPIVFIYTLFLKDVREYLGVARATAFLFEDFWQKS